MQDHPRLETYTEHLGKCTYCPKMCRFSCPVAETERKETYLPGTKMMILNLVKQGRLPVNEEALEAWYRCTGCMLCNTYCLHEVVVPDALIEGRRLAREQGVNLPEVTAVETEAAKAERGFGDLLREHVPEARFNAEAQALFVTDRCTLEWAPELLGKTFELLDAIGDDTLAMDERFDPAGDVFYYESGNSVRLRELIEANLSVLKGRKAIVTDSPALAYMLKVHYAAVEPGIADLVQWLPEFLLDKVSGREARHRSLHGTFAFHDSSYAGRYLGLYDAPRELIDRLLHEDGERVELQHAREQADTSGGVFYAHLYPEGAAAMAKIRVAELEENPELQLITAGSDSLHHLRGALEGDKTRIRHLIDVMHEAWCKVD